jgi:hypothetical protein
MLMTASFWLRLLVLCIVLSLSATTGALADPRDYAQFAQQQVDKDIPVTFITPERVKQHLEAGSPQWLVDVRNRSSYDQLHLPGARSLPLDEFPQRFVEIPRDIPVVLY